MKDNLSGVSEYYGFKCLYDDCEKKTLIVNMLDYIYKNNTISKYNLHQVTNILNTYSFAFKNSMFRNEEEFRYLIYVNKSDIAEKCRDDLETKGDRLFKINFYQSQNTLKPFINIRIDSSVIKKIYLSPAMKNITLKNGLRLFLDYNDYNQVEIVDNELTFLP